MIAPGLIILLSLWPILARAQGLTLRDPAFVGVISSSASQVGGGGGGDTPPTPTEYWTMDETGSLNRVGSVHSVAFVDQSGGSTADHATGLYNNALKLTTGTAQAMRVTTSSTDLAYTTGDSISMSWWTYFETSPATRIPIMELALKDGGDSDAGYIAVQMDSGGGSFAAWVWDNDAEYDEITSVPTLTTSSWHHWVLTYDGGTELLQLTVDETLVGTTSIPVTLPTSPAARLRIETGATAATTRWEEFGVWMDHKLTAGQATWLNNGGAGKTFTDF
jgi:hypothetical protein